MAFGFSPQHEQDFHFNNWSQNEFLVIAIESAQKLGWNVSQVSTNGFKAFTKFSMSSWSEEVNVTVQDNSANIKSKCTSNQILDYGKNRKNVEALIKSIEELQSTVSAEWLESKVAELDEIQKESTDNASMEPDQVEEKSGLGSLFIPSRGYFVTPILVAINILIFVLMLASGVHFMTPEIQDLIDWGANLRGLTLDGQWWRLFTACFIHIGVLHILMNVYALIYIGLILEPYLGKTRFLAAYLITGFVASLASLWWHDATVSAGASGAVFGMYGVFIAMMSTNLLDKSLKQALMTSILVFVGFNLFNGLKPNSGIDNAAHIGGLISGILVGFAFVPSLKQKENKSLKFSVVGVLSVLAISGAFMVFKNLPNDIPKFDQGMARFAELEEKALSIYSLPENSSIEQTLEAIQIKGIDSWNECIKLMEELKALQLPEMLQKQNDVLLEYCQLRLKSFELIYKSIEEQSDDYDVEIEALNNQINALLEGLEGEGE